MQKHKIQSVQCLKCQGFIQERNNNLKSQQSDSSNQSQQIFSLQIQQLADNTQSVSSSVNLQSEMQEAVVCQQCLQRQAKHYTFMSLEISNYQKIVKNIDQESVEIQSYIANQQKKHESMMQNLNKILSETNNDNDQQNKYLKQQQDLIDELTRLQQEEQSYMAQLAKQTAVFNNLMLQIDKNRCLAQSLQSKITKSLKQNL